MELFNETGAIGLTAAEAAREIAAPARDGLDAVLRINAYLATALEERPGRRSLERGADTAAMLQSGWAECGERVEIASAMLAELGVASRRVSFSCVPIQSGHTALEANIDGAWRFIDPTFGIYFSGLEDEAPLSLARAREEFPYVRAWRTAAEIWGASQSILDFTYRPLWEAAIRNPRNNQLAGYILETYFLSQSFGAEQTQRDATVVPIDLTARLMHVLGSADVSGAIAAGFESVAGPFRPTILERLGRCYAGNIVHRFAISSAQIAMVDMEVVVARGGVENLFVSVQPVVQAGVLYDSVLPIRRAVRLNAMNPSTAAFQFVATPPLTFVEVSTTSRPEEDKEIALYRFVSNLYPDWQSLGVADPPSFT